MAYGELWAALPPILQTCFSAPRFPDSGSPVRRAVRQAALPTFTRSSPATTAGPSFSLPLIYSRWTVPRVVIILSSHECIPFDSPFVTMCGMEIKNGIRIREKL